MSTGEVYHTAGPRQPAVQNVVTAWTAVLLQAPRQGLASGPAEDDDMHQLDHVPATLDEAIGLLRATLDGTVRHAHRLRLRHRARGRADARPHARR